MLWVVSPVPCPTAQDTVVHTRASARAHNVIGSGHIAKARARRHVCRGGGAGWVGDAPCVSADFCGCCHHELVALHPCGQHPRRQQAHEHLQGPHAGKTTPGRAANHGHRAGVFVVQAPCFWHQVYGAVRQAAVGAAGELVWGAVAKML